MPISDNRPKSAANGKGSRWRVALLIHALQGGGAERLMSQLANRWSTDHEIHLITWSQSDTDQYELHSSIARHGLGLQIPSGGAIAGVLANLRRIRILRKKLQQIQPDFVLSFCDQMNIVALEATRSMPQIPVWISEHSDPEKQKLSSLWEFWRGRNYPRCSGCIALTDRIADYMTRWIARERLQVIPAAIQTPTDSSAQPYIAQSPSGENSLLFVGRLSPEKRVDLLLDAWQIVQSQLPNWQLLIVGDGSIKDELQRQAAQLQRVNFMGWQKNPSQIMSTSQLYVLCSRYEGFPVALLEAMHCGLPAIATNCSSAIEQLQHAPRRDDSTPMASNDALSLKVIPPESATTLAEAVLELASDVDQRQAMSHAARLSAKRYTWEHIGPMWDAILR
jgi:GalNAc-alpha-(1->4)-GalNAc-alpha-(1->3)-diNAcBac-PP-undecaprenol alpha-1,4-N-acetyl-D-galactosaminyltransferase